VGRLDVQSELGHEPAESWDLTLWHVHHQAGKCGGVDDRMLERTFEAAAHQPGVESVVAVLHQDRPLRKAKKGAPSVLEDWRSDEHRPIDVVTLARVGVDGSTTVDQRVEERESAVEAKTLRAQLQHQERRIAGGLDVEGDELGFVQGRVRSHVWRIDGDLLPWHRRGSAARLEVKGLLPLVRTHQLSRRARRAKSSSSRVTARTRTEASAYVITPTAIGITNATPWRLLNG
jgi:hypothetical protein